MSYEIRYADVVSVRSKIVDYVTTIQTQLSDLEKRYEALLQSGCMTGETADTLKTYITYVHGNILSVVNSMLQEYLDKLLVYENGLYKIEGDRKAVLYEQEMQYLSNALTHGKKKFVGITEDVGNILNSVSDIYSHTAPNTTAVESGYKDTKKIADTLKQDIGKYEHNHRKDCSEVKKYITQINQLLASQQKSQSGTITIEQIAAIVNGSEMSELSKLQQNTKDFYESQQIALGEEYELMQTEAEEEAARQREVEGLFKVLTGVVVIGSIVLTGGAAAPLAIAIEAGAVAYGAAEITEGMQDMYYGAAGNLDSKAFNPLRDTVFQGNQTAYEAFGLVTTVASAGASQLAKNGIEITAKNLASATAKEGFKELASSMAGYGAGEVAGHLGANDGQRQFITIVAGLGMSYGLDRVDALKVTAGKAPVISDTAINERKQFEDKFNDIRETWVDDDKAKEFIETADMYAQKAVDTGACMSKADYYTMYTNRTYKYSDKFIERVKKPYIESGASSIVNQKDLINAFDNPTRGYTIGRQEFGNFTTSVKEDADLLLDAGGKLKVDVSDIETIKGVDPGKYSSGAYQYVYDSTLVKNCDDQGIIRIADGTTPGASSLNIPGCQTWAGKNLSYSESELIMPSIDVSGIDSKTVLEEIENKGVFQIENPTIVMPTGDRIKVEGTFKIVKIGG